MFKPNYAMFFDMHTMQACPDVAHSFEPENFAEKIEKAGIDLVGFHAKCNQGFCYYDTKLGIRHPSLPENYDFFGDVVKALGKRGIKVSAYFNCGLSNEDALRHPEWSRIGMKGEIIHPEIFDLGWHSPYLRTMCFNSPWRDHLLKLIAEVREKYPVAGFLFDSLTAFPCICPHCTAGMKALGMDPGNEEDVTKFSLESSRRMARDISDLLRPRENGLLTYFLGIPVTLNAKIGSYLECECIPTNPVWGYDLLPFTSRYYRNLTDGPVLNMTGRFNTWGNFGSLRPAASIEYDIFFGLANGMRPNIGDHFHPRGDLYNGIFDRVTEVYNKVRRYHDYYENAKNLTDIAVIIQNASGKTPSRVGMTRLLSELAMQFDFIDENCSWEGYKLVILPDNIVMNEKLTALVNKHLASGGKLIATGKAGLDESQKQFTVDLGVKYCGECEYDPAYFRLQGKYAEMLPDMPLATYSKGVRCEAVGDARVIGTVVAPYYNHHWDGVYSYFYAPPDKDCGMPFMVLGSQSAYCAFPLGETYYRHASPDYRSVMKIMLDHLLAEPLLKTNNFSTFGRSFVTASDGRKMVHLLNYVPELRGEMLIVDDEAVSVDVKISLRLDGFIPKNVRIAPDGAALPFTVKNDRLQFTVPQVKGYCLLVIS